MKKFLNYLVISLAALLLVACAPKKTGGNGVSGNNHVEVKIKDGTYVFPKDESSDSKYLALNVEIKNKSNKQLYISDNDITLYNSDDEKISSINVYDSSDKFKTMSYEKVAKDKSVSGYVVFEVNPKDTYELHYSPLYTDIGKKEPEEVTIKVDAKKYADNVDKMEDLAKEYVEKVFLSGDASGKAENVSSKQSDQAVVTTLTTKNDDKKKEGKADQFVLGGDLEKDRANFMTSFTKEFGEEFSYYTPSEAELRTFAEAYTKMNAKRAKVTYQVSSFLPESATVYVRPETIGLENIRTYDLVSKFVNEHRAEYSDYNDAYKAAEKYILEQAPSQFDSIPLVTPKYMESEGYELKFTKKDGKWVVDSSDDYGYKYLVRSFSGSLY